MSREKSEELSLLEHLDPLLFDELSLKMRWNCVAKDPSRVMKDKDMASGAAGQWNIVNHLAPEKVKELVTKKVLKLD